MPRPMVVDDLARLRWAMEPAMHPTSSSFAYVVSGPDPALDGLGYQLVVDGDDGWSRDDARGPCWSPDGERIAFLARNGTRWVPGCRTRSGKEVECSPPPGDAIEVQWAPDGDRLLVLTFESPLPVTRDLPYRVESSDEWNPSAVRSLWVVTPAGDPVPVDARGDVSSARWSPDGVHIAFLSSAGVDADTSIASGMWLGGPGSDRSECLIPPTLPIHTLAWSPNGTSIAYLVSGRDNANSALIELWVLDVGTGTRERLGVELDRSIGKAVRGDDERGIGPPILAWTADSASVLAIYAEGGRSRLARFDLGGGYEDVIAERCVLEFSLGEAAVAYSWSDPQTPGEVSLLDAARSHHQVTHIGAASIPDVELAETTTISITASDGVGVEGWLTLPRDSLESPPLVLQVHGGPHYAIGERFSFDAQRLAAHGLAVLRANPRGSQGYGQAFADGNLGDWGGRDFEDLLALVDQAVAVADLDDSRVAVIGESYGGFLAAWAAASCDRFVVAVVESGIADLLSSAGGRAGPTFWHTELGGAPWENPAIYLERSPITRLDRVSVPVLVIHSEDDVTCPIAHGEAIYSALRDLGADVEFLRVPGEGHFINVFGALSRRLERTAVLDEFLVSRLGATSATTETEETTP